MTHPLHGPRTITGNNQVTLPVEVLSAAKLSKGDDIYIRLDDAALGTLLIVPARVVEQAVEAILRRPGARESDTRARH